MRYLVCFHKSVIFINAEIIWHNSTPVPSGGPSPKGSDGERRSLVRKANKGLKIIAEVTRDINSSNIYKAVLYGKVGKSFSSLPNTIWETQQSCGKMFFELPRTNFYFLQHLVEIQCWMSPWKFPPYSEARWW